MDPNQENQGENNAAGANRQAIFTPQPEQPEIVPGTGIPAQPSVDLSHPYFSNHPTQTFNTDAGDIILNAGTPKPKQNKRPFIIGGIILAVFTVVLVVVLLVVQAMSRPSKTDVIKSFNEYKNYIEYGPDNTGDENNIYISQLSGYAYSSSDADEQTKKIKNLYSDFRTKLEKSSIVISENLRNLISTETALLDYAILYINLDNVIQPAIKSYLSSDNVDAESLATQIVPARSDSGFRTGFRDTLIQYIISELKIQDFYQENYCNTDGATNSECVTLLDDDEGYIKLRDENEVISQSLQRYASRLWAELESCTNAISEGLNE